MKNNRGFGDNESHGIKNERGRTVGTSGETCGVEWGGSALRNHLFVERRVHYCPLSDSSYRQAVERHEDKTINSFFYKNEPDYEALFRKELNRYAPQSLGGECHRKSKNGAKQPCECNESMFAYERGRKIFSLL